MEPLISVIMAVYNSEEFIQEALKSLQAQSLTDWELIAVDDCSKDESFDILKKWSTVEPRIRIFKMHQNSGAGAVRDFAIKQARGSYIAVFDADDICEPERFKKQIDFLQSHPSVVSVGTQTEQIDYDGRPCGTKTFPTDPDKLYHMMYTAIPAQLPTLMVNTTLLPANFSWFDGWRVSEDSLLFFKLACYGKIANLPDFLLKYRYYSQSTSYRKAKTCFYQTFKSRSLARRVYGYKPSIRSRMISGLQFIVVTCLPGRWIPSIYKTTRRIMLWLSGNNDNVLCY